MRIRITSMDPAKKIVTIKGIRALSGLSLKASKDIADALDPNIMGERTPEFDVLPYVSGTEISEQLAWCGFDVLNDGDDAVQIALNAAAMRAGKASARHLLSRLLEGTSDSNNILRDAYNLLDR